MAVRMTATPIQSNKSWSAILLRSKGAMEKTWTNTVTINQNINTMVQDASQWSVAKEIGVSKLSKTASKRHLLCERNRCTMCPSSLFRCHHQGFISSRPTLRQLGHTYKETIITTPMQCRQACSKDHNCCSFSQGRYATMSEVDADLYLKATREFSYNEDEWGV